MDDHDYNLAAFKDACSEDGASIELDDLSSPEKSINLEHTPLKAPHPKKKKRERNYEETAIESVLKAVMEVKATLDQQTQKMDAQTELLKKVETKIEANTEKIKENKANIDMLQLKVSELQGENKSLKESFADLARYKRRWNLRLNGLTEKESEDTRELVIGILTRVVPLSVERLRETVDTVHRLGKKGNAATSNNTPRSIIMQFVSRTVRDDVWKRSRDARVCKELHIHFKEDFSREDRAARAKLWPLVQDARKRGQRAFLKEGYALINNQRVDPD
ncbi:hypothetical protein WMY93_027479 [Mugilogobius chulae]|uniref:Cytoplasmic dynein 2 heavy chain 1-like protein n=1 Tax=Mugilogobius chulae TaxID=88201 RepID=A0AAW0MUS2_9GOBI